MVLLSILLVVAAATFILVRQFRARAEGRHLWRFAVMLGLTIGLVRATLACLGWYVVEHTGGPAQVPAYALAMLSWPEAALLPRRAPGPTSASTYASLFLLLIAGSTACVAVIAAIAKVGLSRPGR